MRKKHSQQDGFTIIEVLIATLVFALVLVVCLEGVTRIGKLYYKAVSYSKAQELIRNLSTDITQQIQFGSKDTAVIPTPTPNTPLIFCVGDYRYRAVLNRTLGSGGVTSILKRMPMSADCELDEAVQPFTGAVEMASRGMRIQRLKATYNTAQPKLWTIDIKVALGEDDLLEYPGLPADTDQPVNYEEVHCKSGIAGSQFCAIAELKTTVIRRIR